MRATASHDLVIKDVVVPAIAMAESRPIGPIDAASVSLFAWFWLSVAAVYTGIAIAAFKFVKEFTGRFKPMALPRPIKYLPGIQFAAADAQPCSCSRAPSTSKPRNEYIRESGIVHRRRRARAGRARQSMSRPTMRSARST